MWLPSARPKCPALHSPQGTGLPRPALHASASARFGGTCLEFVDDRNSRRRRDRDRSPIKRDLESAAACPEAVALLEQGWHATDEKGCVAGVAEGTDLYIGRHRNPDLNPAIGFRPLCPGDFLGPLRLSPHFRADLIGRMAGSEGEQLQHQRQSEVCLPWRCRSGDPDAGGREYLGIRVREQPVVRIVGGDGSKLMGGG